MNARDLGGRALECRGIVDDRDAGIVDQRQEPLFDRPPAAEGLQGKAEQHQPVGPRRKFEVHVLELAGDMADTAGMAVQFLRLARRRLGIDHQNRGGAMGEKTRHRADMAADLDDVRAIAHEMGREHLAHRRGRAGEVRQVVVGSLHGPAVRRSGRSARHPFLPQRCFNHRASIQGRHGSCHR